MRVILFANTDWYLYNFRRSLALHLREIGFEPILISPAGAYGARLLNLGLRWEPLPMSRRGMNPVAELKSLAHLVRTIRRERPALVHGFTIKSAIYGGLAARVAGLQSRVSSVDGMGYVFTSNDFLARILKPLVSALMRSAFAGKSSRLILQNGDDVRDFKRLKIVEPNLVRLIRGAGVDCVRFSQSMATRNRKPEEPIRVLLAARLLWEKGIGEYVDAARRLRGAGTKVSFLLAGLPDHGNPAAVPESTVRQWVGEGLIEWLGHVDDMPKLLKTVDIVTLPSYYREGLPTCLVEAAACGIPIITTDSPGCREVVTDGVDGLLIPKQSSAALAEAIARLCDDRSLAGRLGAAAREKALAEFDERIVIDRTLDVYGEVLSTDFRNLGHFSAMPWAGRRWG